MILEWSIHSAVPTSECLRSQSGIRTTISGSADNVDEQHLTKIGRMMNAWQVRMRKCTMPRVRGYFPHIPLTGRSTGMNPNRRVKKQPCSGDLKPTRKCCDLIHYIFGGAAIASRLAGKPVFDPLQVEGYRNGRRREMALIAGQLHTGNVSPDSADLLPIIFAHHWR